MARLVRNPLSKHPSIIRKREKLSGEWEKNGQDIITQSLQACLSLKVSLTSKIREERI